MSSADRRVRERDKGSRWLRRATAALAAVAGALTGVFSALAVHASTVHKSLSAHRASTVRTAIVVTPAIDATPSIAAPTQAPTTTSAPAIVQSSGS